MMCPGCTWIDIFYGFSIAISLGVIALGIRVFKKEVDLITKVKRE